jgi:hypothetical protein
LASYAIARYVIDPRLAGALNLKRVTCAIYALPATYLWFAAAAETAELGVSMLGNLYLGIAVATVGVATYMGANGSPGWDEEYPPLGTQAIAFLATGAQTAIVFKLTESGFTPAFARELLLSPIAASATFAGLLLLLTLWFAERHGIRGVLRVRS